MDHTTFKQFCALVYERSGINLGDHKEALVNARVGKRMRELGMEDTREYLDFVTGENATEEIVHLLDVISTNVTSFFRESGHFDIVGDLFAQWYAAGKRSFRFWCCASSSGEEPYTLAITLLERLGNGNAEIKILATDISTRILKKCSDGEYAEVKMAGIPLHLKAKYFDAIESDRGGLVYKVKPILRSMISITRINLSKPPFPMQGPFDSVFCRNVMIYFDNPVRIGLLTEIHRVLKPEGYLFVGHAESLTGMVSNFKCEKPSVYLKKSSV